jgi:hypothetical protein
LKKCHRPSRSPAVCWGNGSKPCWHPAWWLLVRKARTFERTRGSRAFPRALRAFHRSPIFHAPSRESFQAFVLENFDGPEIASFSGPGKEYYYYRDYAAVQAVYSRVCAAQWLKGFLAAEDSNWEIPYLAAGSTAYFFSAAVLRATQALIRVLIPGAVPVPIAQIPGMCPDVRPDVLAAAIHAALRYLLVFPCPLERIARTRTRALATAAGSLAPRSPVLPNQSRSPSRFIRLFWWTT